jgi:hypothetical protein
MQTIITRSRIVFSESCGLRLSAHRYGELLREAVVDEVDPVSGNIPGIDDGSGGVEVPLDELLGVEEALVSGVVELAVSVVDWASVSGADGEVEDASVGEVAGATGEAGAVDVEVSLMASVVVEAINAWRFASISPSEGLC